MLSPLELLNFYYSDGLSLGDKNNKLWQEMNKILSWDNILKKGYQIDLCPLLYYILVKALPAFDIKGPYKNLFDGEIVPESILLQLKNEYNYSLTRNLILLEELKNLVKILHDNHIKVIILKGGYLADIYYRNIACRPMSDLDILVEEKDCWKIQDILQTRNYLPVLESHRTRMLHLSFCKSIHGNNVKVEVHNTLAKDHYLTCFDINEMFTKGFMCHEFQLLYISWHAIQHGLSRFIWLCDLVEVFRKNNGQLNWDYINNSSIDFNVHYQFLFSLRLLDVLFNFSKLHPKLYDVFFNDTNKIRFNLSDKFFLLIQNKILNRQDNKNMRFFLYISLTNLKYIFKYISKHVCYRYI